MLAISLFDTKGHEIVVKLEFTFRYLTILIQFVTARHPYKI